ncbi:hypothetical protein BCR41DRAFT_427046 [Lobosporangium transversale]|uniref:Uncharacterized protein n=1 Tax=Lobosporangium transversale TaxID=64571 RepID=A0A1Y2G4C0_9FUNG|nr:hypothetical protein BCR41DRAFT_427046 [Lobosporangium transversale]ORY91813.1 hypothetical protein BCR41DRAFT_427046 [Lobosporangium transversale]|eukprot:XP_021875125.1 hypothetical protein BCR41DRAFT_427046 [Lobosporangium transversale]
MSFSNNTASSSTSKVAGKKRAREELESDKSASRQSSPSTDGPPADPVFSYVPWERPTRDGRRIKKLFLESEHCNFRARTESPLYQDGDEVRPRKYLYLEGGQKLDLYSRPISRDNFDVFWVHEPSLFKQLRRRNLMLVKEADWQRLEASAKASQHAQVAVTSVATETEVVTETSSSCQESTLGMSERQLRKVLTELESVDVESPRSKLLQERAALLLDVCRTFKPVAE